MYDPTLLRDRPRAAQVVIVGVVPLLAGAIAGVLVGVSGTAYWAYAGLIAVPTIIGGFEHEDGWGAADRGLIAGAVYGIGLLLAHAVAGTHAKASLGSHPIFLPVVTAIAGMLLAAIGGRIARVQRERRHAAVDSSEIADIAAE